MSESSEEESNNDVPRGEFAGAIEELHAMKLSASQKEHLDECVAVDEFQTLLKSLVLRDEGAHAVQMGLVVGNLKERLRSMLLLKRMKERSPERVRRLTSHLWTGLQINGEPKAGVRLAFRTGAKTKTRRAKADARE